MGWDETDSIWHTDHHWVQMTHEYGAGGGMRTGRGNQSTWKKSASMPLRPSQTPHDQSWDQAQATALGSW